MKPISRDDVFRAAIMMALSLFSYVGHGISTQQADIACRLRIVELNQARIMQQMGVEVIAYDVAGLQVPSN